MRSYLEIAHVSSTSSFTQLPLADILPGKKARRALERTIGEFRSRTSFFGTFSRLVRCWTGIEGQDRPFPSRARTSRDSRQPTADEDRGRQLDFCPPALIHFSTHTRKVKMAALTVSFAGKIGATAPRVANARAAGEFPSAPRAPDASAPPSRPAEISPFSSPVPRAAPLGRPFVAPRPRPRDDANVFDAAARPKRVVRGPSSGDRVASCVAFDAPATRSPSRVLHCRDPRSREEKNPGSSNAGPARSAPLPASRRGRRRVRAPVPTPAHDD